MTYEEFLDILSKTERKWELYYNSIRLNLSHQREYYCPITSITKEFHSIADYMEAGQKLGLSNHDIYLISTAADYLNYKHESVRNDLLKACGLKNK